MTDPSTAPVTDPFIAYVADPPQHLDRVDALLADPRPYTPADADHATGHAGPGYRVEELYVSRDFRHDEEDRQACEREHDLAEARLAALAEVLTARWGSPHTVDLFSYLRAGYDWECAARPVPEPLALLSCKAVTLHVWPLPDGGAGPRWLGLSVGQEDKELPVVLSATLADGPVPARRLA